LPRQLSNHGYRHREAASGVADFGMLEFSSFHAENTELTVKISREDVLRVAELAYLDLSESELETYRAQIDEILEYIGKLNELDTAHVEPMAQVLADDQTADATLREDVEVPIHAAAELLKQAPDPEPPYFRVPKVIER
jgi:aspartyl-tRNA(Asn)/glutamyl-tRNA(Gln) amidotransferase subunit C